MNSKVKFQSLSGHMSVIIDGGVRYNAANHSLGVALHSGSGWLCRDPFFDIPKPLFVLKELICLTTCGDLYRSQKPNRFVCFVVCCHWRHYYARMRSSRGLVWFMFGSFFLQLRPCMCRLKHWISCVAFRNEDLLRMWIV